MRLWGCFLGLLLLALPAHADQIDYTLTVQNVEGVGDLSWTIETNGFIQPLTPDNCPLNSSILSCGSHTSFLAVSEPSQGDGCQITNVWLDPNYSTETFFSPLCDGKYDSLAAGVVPDPGSFGTWSWQGTNPDNTQNFVTLTISDPPTQTPEPQTWAMLWIGLIGLALMKFATRGKRLKAALPLALSAATFPTSQPGHL